MAQLCFDVFRLERKKKTQDPRDSIDKIRRHDGFDENGEIIHA